MSFCVCLPWAPGCQRTATQLTPGTPCLSCSRQLPTRTGERADNPLTSPPGPAQVGTSGRVERQEAYSRELGRLLGLGGERCDDEAASEHRHEGAPLHHWVLAQVFCESGARGCGAWGNRAGSMREPSLQAGRSVAERRSAKRAREKHEGDRQVGANC